MAEKFITASISPPKRVQILKADSGGYWKPGQFGYAMSYSTHPGMHTMDNGVSAAGDLSYLVSKASHGRGGALWFSHAGLRFTKAPTPEIDELVDAERVALDLLLENGNGHGGRKEQLRALVPSAMRRGHVKTLAEQLRSLRKR